MTSSFLRSTRNLSSVHSGSGKTRHPKSSSEPGTGESVLRSLFEPWSDCCKYPLNESHWAAIAPHSNLSSGRCVSKWFGNCIKCRTLNANYRTLLSHIEIVSGVIVAPPAFPRASVVRSALVSLLSLELERNSATLSRQTKTLRLLPNQVSLSI